MDLVTATMPPWMIAMQLAAAVQLQTQLHCITQLSDWAELESRIPNKFTSDWILLNPWPCPCLILRCCHCLFWTFQIIPVRFDHDVYNLFIPFTKSSSQSNMTYRKIYTIYHRQQSTRTGLNTHLTALHTKYCLLTWLFIRTIEMRASVFRTTMHFALHDFWHKRDFPPNSGSYNIIKTFISSYLNLSSVAFCQMTSSHSKICVLWNAILSWWLAVIKSGLSCHSTFDLSPHNFYFFMKRGPDV